MVENDAVFDSQDKNVGRPQCWDVCHTLAQEDEAHPMLADPEVGCAATSRGI
jgi:hypothetical protein